MPIGNLSSQFFANVYLNGFDHFVKEKLKAEKYVRYVDDFALFSDDREFLAAARVEIEEYLASLRVKIHPVKSQLFETRKGANFVGFRIFPEYIRVRAENLRRGRRRLKQMEKDFATGKISEVEIEKSLQSWFAHLQQADTWKLRNKILTSFMFGGDLRNRVFAKNPVSGG